MSLSNGCVINCGGNRGISSVATVAAIKVDIGWIKQTQVEFKIQLEKFEQRMNALEKGE
ncbi:hypothetical protein QYZ44_11995 [Vibrio parahaemolyticus]|nr:hypothetical protein [Vibrio parahaemolyticus]MDN4710268.1 hypothetical protein [Vibrio parahaemolyticus]